MDNAGPQESITNYSKPRFHTSKSSHILFVIAILVTAALFSLAGFIFGKQSVKQQDIPLDQVASSEQEVSEVKSVATDPACEDIHGLDGYKFCRDFILRSDAVRISNVSSYSLSPNKEWLFVVRYSNSFVENGGAPEENALSMINIKTGKIIELFSQIYFPSFTEESWSPDGKGIVFTASGESRPDSLGETNLFAVVYCTESCKVVARDAGPAGIQGDPAFFVNDKIHYSDIDGEQIEVSL